jgi:mRNA interferase RelE/StbE
MHNILLTKRAGKEFTELPQTNAKRVTAALDELSSLGTKSSNTKKLQTPFPGYRKRVGNFRILFEINKDIIIVYRISKRTETCK